MFVSTFMEIFGFVVRKLTSDCAICHYPGYSSISIDSVYITVRLCKYFSHKISIMPKVSQCANSKRPAPLVIILNRIYTQNSIHCNCVHLPSTWSSHLYCTWGTMHLAFINIYTGNNRRCCYLFFSLLVQDHSFRLSHIHSINAAFCYRSRCFFFSIREIKPVNLSPIACPPLAIAIWPCTTRCYYYRIYIIIYHDYRVQSSICIRYIRMWSQYI